MKTIKTLTAILLSAVLSTAAFGAAKPGEPAPDFTLTDVEGNEHSLDDFEGKFVVLEWLNHNCPYVKKHYNSDNMQELQDTYTGKDVVWLSINSAGKEHKDYNSPEDAKKLAEEKGSKATAILQDPTGEVGKAYGASTTPHMFVINPEGTLIYAGAIDSNSSADPKDIEGAENYVASALNAAMEGKEVETASTKPYGCSVKYAK
jgi:peroxiredoxin